MTRAYIRVYVCPVDISRSDDRRGGDLSYAVNGGIGYSARHLDIADCPVDPEHRTLDLNGNGIVCPDEPESDGDPSDRTYFKLFGLFFLENWISAGTVRHYALADVKDGLSQTFMVSENVRVGYDPRSEHASFATPDPLRCAFYIGNPCGTGNCTADAVDYSLSNSGGNRINSGRTKPEGRSPIPNSFHDGGVHMAFADGHVRFLSESIDGAVYAALASPQGMLLEGTRWQQAVVSGASH